MAEPTKLTLELYRYENLVFGKCKYLLESLKGTGVLIENGRYQIISDTEPGIEMQEGQKMKLSVWGNNAAANDQAFSYVFSDPEAAEEFTINTARLTNRLNGSNVELQTLIKVL